MDDSQGGDGSGGPQEKVVTGAARTELIQTIKDCNTSTQVNYREIHDSGVSAD
jgi:hypothetical protein